MIALRRLVKVALAALNVQKRRARLDLNLKRSPRSAQQDPPPPVLAFLRLQSPSRMSLASTKYEVNWRRSCSSCATRNTIVVWEHTSHVGPCWSGSLEPARRCWQ